MLETVDDMVANKGQVVTYKLLCIRHGVDVDAARAVLCEYAHERAREDGGGSGGGVSATYVLSGTLREGGTMAVVVAQAGEVDAKRALFEDGDGAHIDIYSVQQSRPTGSSSEYGAAAVAADTELVLGAMNAIIAPDSPLAKIVVPKTAPPVVRRTSALVKKPLVQPKPSPVEVASSPLPSPPPTQ
jgi:hypothetical protein